MSSKDNKITIKTILVSLITITFLFTIFNTIILRVILKNQEDQSSVSPMYNNFVEVQYYDDYLKQYKIDLIPYSDIVEMSRDRDDFNDCILYIETEEKIYYTTFTSNLKDSSYTYLMIKDKGERFNLDKIYTDFKISTKQSDSL